MLLCQETQNTFKLSPGHGCTIHKMINRVHQTGREYSIKLSPTHSSFTKSVETPTLKTVKISLCSVIYHTYILMIFFTHITELFLWLFSTFTWLVCIC